MSPEAASASVIEVGLILRLLLPFVLGAIFTLIITSVNHRRDHIKHVREIISKAIKDISEKGVSYWASEYSVDRMVQLQGSVTYFQHLFPYAYDSTNVPEKSKDEMSDLFGDISHVALYVDGELDESTHKIDAQRVTELLVICANAEALSNRNLLERMSFSALMSDWLTESYNSLVRWLKKVHYDLFVP
ncbi:hypothetical protein [Yoonia vestfoldensis]|uniref:Uncharacterized protein n=1 Tax=Yoonia vestfoldensis TaxID=245188 RepID=A0A1Y0EHE0_9RHOB|nr:hypothetical protein [Yoonia vestfoldensis]ARU03004.1 hypothetical protein LOKVESSMR4R_03738 [Yoonia vestfoldensis]